MRTINGFLLIAAIADSLVNAALTTCQLNPTGTSPPALCNSADPPFTQPEVDMFNNIICPTTPGGAQAVKKPYLLVPGTGNTGAESWQDGYVKLLGKNAGGLGFDVCFLAELGHMLGDAQDTAERIAYAANALATISGKGVIIQGWSQGNLDIQWALTFWQSMQSNTAQFISLAGDFKGTTLTALENLVPDIASQLGIRRRNASLKQREVLLPVPPSLHQQLVGSNFLTALKNAGGLNGKVPTTSIFSTADDVVSPEDATSAASSYLAGDNVGNILIQTHCPGLPISHADQLQVNYTFQVVQLALKSKLGFASQADVQGANIPCNRNAAPGVPTDLGDEASLSGAEPILANIPGSSLEEPPVREYAIRASESRQRASRRSVRAFESSAVRGPVSDRMACGKTFLHIAAVVLLSGWLY